MDYKLNRRNRRKVEIEQKERVVQTYIIIATLLVTFNQNIVTALNVTALNNTTNTTNTSNALQASSYILAFFTFFIVSILIYNTLLTLTHDESYLKGVKNFIAIIASSCLSSILINYIIIQGRINIVHIDDNLINQLINQIFSNVHIFIIVYLLLLIVITLPLLFIQDDITIIFERVTEITSKKMKDVISINNFIQAIAILLLQYSVYYTLKTIF